MSANILLLRGVSELCGDGRLRLCCSRRSEDDCDCANGSLTETLLVRRGTRNLLHKFASKEQVLESLGTNNPESAAACCGGSHARRPAVQPGCKPTLSTSLPCTRGVLNRIVSAHLQAIRLQVSSDPQCRQDTGTESEGQFVDRTETAFGPRLSSHPQTQPKNEKTPRSCASLTTEGGDGRWLNPSTEKTLRPLPATSSLCPTSCR